MSTHVRSSIYRGHYSDFAYQSTSIPLYAATLSGIVSRCSGSTTPSVGRRALLAMPKMELVLIAH